VQGDCILSSETKQRIVGGGDWFSIFIQQYGQLAFGIAAFLLIWFSVMKPELEVNRLTFEQQERVIDQMESIMSQMSTVVREQRGIAETNNATSQVLERTVDKLAR